jgi:hypothetical protein
MAGEHDQLRTLLRQATSDLRAPEVHVRPSGAVVVPLPTAAPHPSWRRRRVLHTAAAAAVGAAVATAAVLGAGRTSPTPGGARAAAPVAGPAVLDRLAESVQSLPAPTQRYAVQVEQQTEGGSSYRKATVVDRRTGDTWTYQQGDGVPTSLPMAPHFVPTEAQLQARYPTDRAELRKALVAQAVADTGTPGLSAQDLAVTQAIDTLWNPLVQPALRAALVSVIARSPGIAVDAQATDALGRRAIRITYVAASLHQRLSVYLDPATGDVLQTSQRSTSATSPAGMSHGSDVYLQQYWTNTPPTVDPLGH